MKQIVDESSLVSDKNPCTRELYLVNGLGNSRRIDMGSKETSPDALKVIILWWNFSLQTTEHVNVGMLYHILDMDCAFALDEAPLISGVIPGYCPIIILLHRY